MPGAGDSAASRPDPSVNLTTDPLLSSVPVHEGYKVLGGVVLYQKLGAGGMGAVYKGRHLRLDIDVALKVAALPAGTRPEHAAAFLQRFIREARTAAAVRHPNLIRVYDVNAEAGVHYLIMDYVDGESAADRLRRKRRLSEQEAVEICLGAAEGLAEAHAQGIVHRDVKPDNILIDRKGAVVVADLGLAKAYSTGEESPALSMGISLTQQAMGTPYYMSPEQTRSAKDVGPAADVWSLGVTLYQLVSGEPPWRESDITDLINRIRNDPAPDVRRRCEGLSDGLFTLIDKALRKALDERFADCGEMAEALRKHLESLKTSPRSLLPDEEAGATKMALVSVTPPPSNTLTLIAQAALRDAPVPDVRLEASAVVTPPTSIAGQVGVDDVIEKRMDAEALLVELQGDFPDADVAEVEAIRRELRIAEAAEGKDAAAAMRRVEKAVERLVGLRVAAHEVRAEEERLKRQREAAERKRAEGAAIKRRPWYGTLLLALGLFAFLVLAVGVAGYIVDRWALASMPQPEERAPEWRKWRIGGDRDRLAYLDTMMRGRGAEEKGDLSAAIVEYNNAIRAISDDPRSYLWRGHARERTGRPAHAMRDFEKAFQLEPYSLSDHAGTYFTREEWDLAIYFYDIAIHLNPGDSHSYYFRGWAKKAKWDRAGARKDFEAARRLGYSGEQ